MSFYLVAGQGASTDAALAGEQLPTRRPRCYPSDTTDAEWHIKASYVPVGGVNPTRGGRPVTYPRRDVMDAIRYLDQRVRVAGVARGLPTGQAGLPLLQGLEPGRDAEPDAQRAA